MLFGGIDWSDQSLDYELRSTEGQVLAEGQVARTPQGMADLFAVLERHAAPSEIGLAIETSHGAWIQALLDRGYRIYPVNPKVADSFRESMSANGDKSDKIDRHVLAFYLQTYHRRLRCLTPDDPEIIALRTACQDRLRLVEEHTAKSHELLAILKAHYPAVLGLFGDHAVGIALDFLQQFPTQHQMRSLSPAKLRKWLSRHGYNQPGRVEEMVALLKAPALPVPDHLQKAKAPLIHYLAQSLRMLQETIAQREKQIDQDFTQLPQCRWAQSLPGAGQTLEPSLLAIFGRDPHRFASAAEARALMGTAPVTKSSGRSRTVKFRMGCWKFARRTMHLFADHSRRTCHWAQETYQRHRDRGKTHHQALRALAHKWVKIIWALVRTGQIYNEAVFLKSQQRYDSNRKKKAPFSETGLT